MDKSTQDDLDVIDVRQLVAIVWLRRWWVFFSLMFFTSLFVVVAFAMKPVYSASAVIVPASAGRSVSGALGGALGQLGGLASLAGFSIGGSGDTETTEALAILKSREFINKFIADKNLLPELFPAKWDEVNMKWKVPQQKQPTPFKAYRYFTNNVLSISQDKKTTLVTIKIEWSDRIKAAEWANELVNRINETMRLRAIENTEASIGYLERELKSTTIIATQDAINRLIESQVKQRMLANVTPEYGFRIVDKAIESDADEPTSPNKVVLTILGALTGVGIGILLAFIYRK